MAENIFILKDKNFAVELDEKKEIVYYYHYNFDEVKKSTKSILLTIEADSMQEINEYFNIDIQEYGIRLDDSARREFNSADKKEISENVFTKYLMIFFVIVLLYMIFFDNSEVDKLDEVNTVFGSLALFGVSLVLILIFGKEQDKEDKVKTKLKYNITTKALPTKDEQLDILEAKIDMLLKEKENKNG